jgi:nucleoside-diphosphate-sugar epimerase
MKILVTGSEGSLMQYVIPVLLEQGHEVIGVDNFARYGEIERKRNYEFVRGDLTNMDFVNSLFKNKNIDGVIQAAALIYGVGGFNKYPADILSKDMVLHQNILWAMNEHSVKKIAYISSSMVYERCNNHPSKEEDAFNSLIPSTDYGMSKLVGEKLCIAFARQYNMDYVIWRPFNIITPHESAEKEQGLSHVFADFIQNLLIENKNPLPIFGDGEQIRCFTWIEDIANTIGKYSFNDKTNNEIYNLGNPEPTSMKELAKMIYQGEDELEFVTVKEYSDDVIIRIPDITKAQNELGFKPTKKIKDSIKICIQKIKDQKLV